jgi:hypothetical protein
LLGKKGQLWLGQAISIVLQDDFTVVIFCTSRFRQLFGNSAWQLLRDGA